ncbi:hypothetical protein HPB48_008467 [Haemaphysalis longicornis]|uniref:Ig-like domain-containing protein n=1 Tax=Haemaphysalis longicornis TaxID=44386 RepID=A0A9J6FN81_HAELO|nr:hypothetical protein HPB48_008467 [Haemaphysalis longicornis]
MLASPRPMRIQRSVSRFQPSTPEIQPFVFSRNIALGQRASVACVAVGGLAPFRFEWSHNDRPIINTATRHVVEVTASISALTLERVAAEDLGNYTCTVTNAHGRDSYSAALVVEGDSVVSCTAFLCNDCEGFHLQVRREQRRAHERWQNVLDA